MNSVAQDYGTSRTPSPTGNIKFIQTDLSFIKIFVGEGLCALPFFLD